MKMWTSTMSHNEVIESRWSLHSSTIWKLRKFPWQSSGWDSMLSLLGSRFDVWSETWNATSSVLEPKKKKKNWKTGETMWNNGFQTTGRPQIIHNFDPWEKGNKWGRWILSSCFLLEVIFSLQHLEILLSSGGRDHSFVRSRWLEFTVRVPERKELHNISAPDICSWISLSLVEYKPIHLQEEVYPTVRREHLKGNKLNNSWSSYGTEKSLWFQ